MLIEIDDAALRKWFNLHPSTPMTMEVLLDQIERHPRRDRLYSFAEFLSFEMEEQVRRSRSSMTLPSP